jgi:tRNA pseudouridine55 synthase
VNGVVVIDKPKGWTSHDVVARVRSMLRVKKAGHGGTLDPLATGVLPVYVGEGTKLAQFNLEGTKEYRAKMKLGQETDTLDADGKVTSERPVPASAAEEIEKVLGRFRGLIRQVPPLFSAVKHEGKPLYKRVRAGEKPVVTARQTTVYELVPLEVALPFVTLEVACARGTYVRTLCADIGTALGCGAHVTELRRLRSGKFTLAQAVSLEDLSRALETQDVGRYLLPLNEGVAMEEAIRVGDEEIPAIRQGRPVRLSRLPEAKRTVFKNGQRVSILSGAGMLLAIAEAQENGTLKEEGGPILRILRVFHC